MDVNFQSGKILRIENWGLAFIQDPHSNEIYPFTFDRIQGYAGETVSETGLRVGRSVQFALNKGVVSTVRLAAAAAMNGTAHAARSHSRGA